MCWVAILLGSLSYGQTHVAWLSEVVDSSRGSEAGSFSALGIDRMGNFHVVYSNRTGTALRYAFREKTQTRWDKTTIDTSGGAFADLAVDSHGWAHVAYNSPKSGGLHYAHWDGRKWQKILVDSGKTNREISIQLDSQDHPQISYYREEYGQHHPARCLKYAYFDGTTWYIQTADHRQGTGSWNSLALDREGRPYISYSIATGNLGIAYLDQAGWKRGFADSPDFKGKTSLVSDSSLAISAKGEPYVVYIDVTKRTINYAWREDVVWHRETIDSLVSTGTEADRISLKLDKSGRPHVAYYDSGLGTLKYATRDKTEWHTETIDNNDAGEYESLSLDENDQPFVSYYTAVNRELRIAHRQPSDPEKGP